MSTPLSEAIEFLDIASSKGFLNGNTTNARKTACNKFLEILDEDQKSVEYVRDNLEIIKARFSNLNKDVAGKTVDEYGRRVQLVLNDFTAWTEDRAGWERSVSAKQTARATGDGDKKPRAKKPKAKPQAQAGNGADHSGQDDRRPDPEARKVTFPIRPDFDLEITLPRAGLTVAELRKVAYFLLPYTSDWEPTDAPRNVFPMLEDNQQGS